LDFPYHKGANHLLKNLYGTKWHGLSLHNMLLFLQSLFCEGEMQLLKVDNHLQMLKVDDEREVVNQFYLLT
jgi:hypothetical protein